MTLSFADIEYGTLYTRGLKKKTTLHTFAHMERLLCK